MLAQMKGMAGVLIGALGGDTLVDYWHAETDETLEKIPAYFKSRMQVKDPYGGQTQYQDVPRYRIADLPWPEDTLGGDIITDAEGRAWEVQAANTSPMGITTAIVSETKPRVMNP